MKDLPRWLEWARALQTLSQTGLAYTKDTFDAERYHVIQQIAAEILASHTEHEPQQLVDLFAGEYGYATPKVDVRGAAFRDGQIMLVRELLDGGRWTLPGGWADVGDSPGEAVVREIHEEAGFECRAVKLAAVYDRNRRGHPYHYWETYKLFFICEITGGEPAVSSETGGVGFFEEHRLPELSISRVTPQEIAMLFEHFRHPDLPTEFD